MKQIKHEEISSLIFCRGDIYKMKKFEVVNNIKYQ